MKFNHQTIQCWRARWSRSFSIFVKKKSNRKQIKKPTEPNLKSNKCWRIKPKIHELKKKTKKQANLSESSKPKLIKKPNLKSNKCSMMKLKKHELQNKKKKNQTWVNLLKKKKWPPAAGHMKRLKHHYESQGIGNGRPLTRSQKGIGGIHAHIHATIFFITWNIW
jgi:hypothetical protein